VFDSGFLHLLDAEESGRFIADVASLLARGDRYYVHAFAVEFPVANSPRAVTQDELRARFSESAGWRILEVRAAEFRNAVAPPVPAIAACIERL
jgi:hypothetical protein